ncbi:MAG: hypothetical protein ABI193_16860 [Minicystis sp.]
MRYAPSRRSILDDSTAGYDCRDQHNGNAYCRTCYRAIDFATLPAGTPLGLAGRAPTANVTAVFAMDLALFDRRVPHPLADPGLMPGWAAHAVCPLDYFAPDSPGDALRAKLGRVDGDSMFHPVSSCGTVYWDIPGTARGVWVDPQRVRPTQDPNLTLPELGHERLTPAERARGAPRDMTGVTCLQGRGFATGEQAVLVLIS